MNGAESLIQSFVEAGVDVCFANPGTSEMHLVQAIDGNPGMRAVLALFEGVCTGAADGYGRMTGKPATTLLHLGPGLGNGIANLHNARRAGTPLINLIGNHPDYHIDYDAPLTSNIDALAQNVSSWIKSDSTSESLAGDGMEALQASLTPRAGSLGGISTLITPADACWGPASGSAHALAQPVPAKVADDVVRNVGERLDAQSMILLNGDGLTEAARVAAGRVASVTGCKVAVTTFPARIDNGAGRPSFIRLPYFPEHILATLKDTSLLVLAGAEAPVSFFAYPDTPGYLVPETCDVENLADGAHDVVDALGRLADHVNAPMNQYAVNGNTLPEMPTGKLSAGAAGAVIARLLPEEAIICGDSGGGGAAFGPTQQSVPHTWLNLTGGSIGQGGPVSVGASVACPDRRVLALLGDGASMYTNQAFWTEAREGLNVTTVIYNNRRYGILETEYLRLGVNEIGERAADLFDLGRPFIDFVGLASSMGVPGTVAETAEDFHRALALSFSQPGPFLIEARV